jgi:ABC-2 type transport system permease protein
MKYTYARPLVPFGFLLYYVIIELVIFGGGMSGHMFDQFAGVGPMQWIPYNPLVLCYLAVGWVIGYLLIRLSAYLLEKKLAI